MKYNFLNNIKVSDETNVRILLYEIRDRNPNAIKFNITTNDVTSILFYMKIKHYHTISLLYGELLVNEILKIYEEYENFEECQIIKNELEILKKYKT